MTLHQLPMSREEESAFYEHFPTLNARLIVNRVPYKGLEHLVRMGAHVLYVLLELVLVAVYSWKPWRVSKYKTVTIAYVQIDPYPSACVWWCSFESVFSYGGA